MLSCNELDVLADIRSVDVLNASAQRVKPGVELVVGSADQRRERIVSNRWANGFDRSAHGAFM